jgi:hypothetical protein
MKQLLMAVVVVGLVAGGAFANECPSLQAQIDTELGNRADEQAAAAKALAQEAWALHEAGKHAESVAKYNEAAKAGGIELKHMK